MEPVENFFISRNKLIEERIDYCVHAIETRIDKLYEQEPSVTYHTRHEVAKCQPFKLTSPYSSTTFITFQAPYIRDLRGFSGPVNDDVRQIRDLNGTENVDILIKNKHWSNESEEQLKSAVLDFYAQIHIIQLIKQKNILAKQADESKASDRHDLEQKISLIEEQTKQVRARKEERIFVPENRCDPNIDWCAMSAKLSNTHHDAQDCRLMWSNRLHWSVNDGMWTKEEDDCLLSAVEKFGKNDWDSVANELNSNRLPWQCCSRYHQEFANACSTATPIADDDSDKILEVINLCRIGNYVPWNQVMYFIKYHGLLQVKYQWLKHLCGQKSSQTWTHHEDALLLRAVEKFGERDWSRIANYIPDRSNKSCRERYTMRLKFSKRAVGNWRKREDELLMGLIDRFGTNWSLVAEHFPERNGHQIRNRYELLKSDSERIGPIRHRKLYRNDEGQFVCLTGHRRRPASDKEVESRLHEIFSTYQDVRAPGKSIVCRSSQDENIHQTLINVIRCNLTNRELGDSLLNCVVERALKESAGCKHELFPPSYPTLRGFRAWAIQQDYLKQFSKYEIDMDSISSSPEYHRALKVAMSLFAWPSALSRIYPPELDMCDAQTGSIIERDSKNLYLVREIQKQITSHIA